MIIFFCIAFRQYPLFMISQSVHYSDIDIDIDIYIYRKRERDVCVLIQFYKYIYKYIHISGVTLFFNQEPSTNSNSF